MSLLSLSLSHSQFFHSFPPFLFSLFTPQTLSPFKETSKRKGNNKITKALPVLPAAIPSPRMRIKYRTKQVLRALFFLFFSTQTPASRFTSFVFLKKVCRYRHGAERNTHLLTHSFFGFFNFKSSLRLSRTTVSLSLFSLSLSLSLSRLNGALRS